MADRERTIRQMMDPENVEKMKRIRIAVEETIKRHRENTEAAVIAGGLMQLVRMLLDQYADKDKDLHQDLVRGAVAFLMGSGEPSERPKKKKMSGLWIPKSYLQ